MIDRSATVRQDRRYDGSHGLLDPYSLGRDLTNRSVDPSHDSRRGTSTYNAEREQQYETLRAKREAVPNPFQPERSLLDPYLGGAFDPSQYVNVSQGYSWAAYPTTTPQTAYGLMPPTRPTGYGQPPGPLTYGSNTAPPQRHRISNPSQYQQGPSSVASAGQPYGVAPSLQQQPQQSLRSQTQNPNASYQQAVVSPVSSGSMGTQPKLPNPASLAGASLRSGANNLPVGPGQGAMQRYKPAQQLRGKVEAGRYWEFAYRFMSCPADRL